MECTLLEDIEAEAVAAPIPTGDVKMLHIDGVSNIGGFGAGMILVDLDGIIAEQALRFSFKISINETKYQHFWQAKIGS